MRRAAVWACLALLLLGVALSFPAYSKTQSGLTVSLSNQYIVSKYGSAIVNETVTFNNTASSSASFPSLIQVGIPAPLASQVIGGYSVSGGGFTLKSATPGAAIFQFEVGANTTGLQAGATATFSLKALVKNIANVTGTTSVSILVLQYPSTNLELDSYTTTIRLPFSTFLSPIPTGFSSTTVNGMPAYKLTVPNSGSLPGLVITAPVQQQSSMDFHPLRVFSATRTITTTPNGAPQVRDSFTLKNLGPLALSSLNLSPLMSGSVVTVVPSTTPPLVNPARALLLLGALQLGVAPFGASVGAGQNFTATVVYNLDPSYFSTSVGRVNVNVPFAPPLPTPVDVYTMRMSLPNGIAAASGQTVVVKDASPLAQGTTQFAYSITLGWASDRAIPAASVVFFVALVGLFFSAQKTEETGEEEVTTSGQISGMVKAFEEKTDLINTMFQEIRKESPANLSKASFDERRSRLDAFRSRALQRLNEVKQKTGTRKFSELLAQLHDSEREVDRASKDVLNLYEQYYLQRMRQETFEKLEPSYKKRLAGAVNHQSDLLNLAQRESKTL